MLGNGQLQSFGDADMEDPDLLAELAELAGEAEVAGARVEAAGAGAGATRDTQGMS